MLTDAQVKHLLVASMAYDNRKLPGEANVRAWKEAAHRTGWAFEEALEAIHAHYAESTEFIMPGHITQRIKGNRRQPAPVEAFGVLEAAQSATEEHRLAVIRQFAERMAKRVPDGGRPPRRRYRSTGGDAA